MQSADAATLRIVPGNIFLVGMMGAGKTSVGKLLARQLGKTFYDSDQVIESRTGVKIPSSSRSKARRASARARPR